MKQLEEVKRDYDDIKDSQRFDNRGERRGKQVYDGSPNSALNIWADGMQGFMVSQSLRWFKSEMSDWRLNDIDEVRVFLQEYEEAMYAAFNRSNFYAVLGEWFRDAGSIGTATLYTEENIEKTSVHIPIHPREAFIAENKFGEVDTLFRKFQLTARQAVQKFGKDNLSDLIIKNSEDHPEKKHEFIHAVFPNDEPMFGKLTSVNKKYKSVYILTSSDNTQTGDEHIVREGGFDIFPYAVWRFRKNSDEIYGYSPAADAMTEVFSLNQIGKTMLRAAHMSVASPLNVPVHMRGNVKMEPDGFNYFENSKDIISPINTGINFPIGIDREEKLQKLIEDKYRVEFFLILARSEREMTATEIMERQAEKAVLMGPQVDRLITEGLSKVFDIVSEIEDRAGRLPSPPRILSDSSSDISIRFVGPLAQAQRRLFKMQPIKNGLNELGQASVLFPHIVDRIDEDKLSEEILDSADFPQTLMRSDTELQALREARAQALAKQQAMEQMGQMAEAYPKIKDAPEEGSPAALIGEAMGV
jgi:hypothetical protein